MCTHKPSCRILLRFKHYTCVGIWLDHPLRSKAQTARPFWFGEVSNYCFAAFAKHSGSTAVGHHAVQLLALSGYKVFVTASESNHAYLRTLGADQCFDYKHSDVLDKIKAAAGSEGIYAAYDPAATGDSTLKCIGKQFLRSRTAALTPHQMRLDPLAGASCLLFRPPMKLSAAVPT